MHPTLKLMLRELEIGPATKFDLAHVVGISHIQAHRWMKRAKEEKLVFIGAWERKMGKPLPVYSLGNRYDTPKPKPRTDAEQAKRQRERSPEKVRAAQKRWRQKNKEHLLEMNRKRWARVKKAANARRAKWREENREYVRERHRKWEARRRLEDRAKSIANHSATASGSSVIQQAESSF